MRLNRFSSHRLGGCLLAAATILCLIPAESSAGVPTRPQHANAAGNPHAADPPNCRNDFGNPSVYPPCSSYGEWTAKWWEWLLGIPFAVNPNFDSTGVNCAQQQSGPVWFLPGAFDLSWFPLRTCTIPQGKAILLPLPNTAWGAGLGDCRRPWEEGPDVCSTANGTGLSQLRAGAASFVDTAVILEVKLDGVPIQNLDQYRFQSPAFGYKLPDGNILTELAGFPVPAGNYAPAVSDGYWLMFKPLSPGLHTIYFKTIYFGIEGEGTWHLTVQ